MSKNPQKFFSENKNVQKRDMPLPGLVNFGSIFAIFEQKRLLHPPKMAKVVF
jgi:hypothetical protein